MKPWTWIRSQLLLLLAHTGGYARMLCRIRRGWQKECFFSMRLLRIIVFSINVLWLYEKTKVTTSGWQNLPRKLLSLPIKLDHETVSHNGNVSTDCESPDWWYNHPQCRPPTMLIIARFTFFNLFPSWRLFSMGNQAIWTLWGLSFGTSTKAMCSYRSNG